MAVLLDQKQNCRNDHHNLTDLLIKKSIEKEL